MILRANDIETLILFGISTSGVVLSTVRHAADADYRLIVIKDCCADQDPEVHACLVDKVFPRQSTVVSADDFLNAYSYPYTRSDLLPSRGLPRVPLCPPWSSL